jgi:deoxyadenosine/deoxycytidine kinase
MKKIMTKIYSLAGFPGVGKTTTLEILKNHLCDYLFLPDENQRLPEISSLHRRPDFSGKYQEIQEIFFEIALNRLDFMNENIKNYKGIFLDRGFEDTWLVTEYYASLGLLSLDYFKRKYYSQLINYFSDTVFFMEASIQNIENRIQQRNFISGNIKRTGDDTFMDQLSEFYLKWYRENSNCIIVKTDDVDQIVAVRVMLEHIKKSAH